MKWLLPFLLLPLASLATTKGPICPAESILIEFMSPITGGKKSFCGLQKDGTTIKHGEEWSYDRKGELVKKSYFHYGVEGSAPTQEVKNLPGAEEAKILANIHDLIQVLSLKKNSGNSRLFKIHKCDKKPEDWGAGALFNKTVPKSYAFEEGCDVQGQFTANLMSAEFPVNFELRNLEDINKVSMKVKMSIQKTQGGISYHIVISEGEVFSPKRNGSFKVEYDVTLNPLTLSPTEDGERGRIVLTKLNGKEVSAEERLRFYQ
jgi:hypothetical protein